MAVASTNTWISFFKDAGIPPNVAATYALTFWNNRIQMDMLLDLNKEYLRDMGITVMGDIIAILRHAKMVHEETAREKVLGSSNTRVVNVSTLQRNEIIAEGEVKGMPGTSANGNMKKVTRMSTQPSLLAAVKKKIVKTKAATSLTSSEASEKKIRRVLPEHEGRYKITMPSGSTVRSKEILAKMKTVSPPKKTVFDRLGNDGDVTSTTESESPRITITGLDNVIVKNSIDKPSSVFSRLGEKYQTPSSTTVSASQNDPDEDVDDDEREEHHSSKILSDKTLPYAGILKQPSQTIIKTSVLKKEASTMRADVESSGGIVKKLKVQMIKTSPNTRLKGIHLSNTAGVLASRLPQTKPNVKARLGFSTINTGATSSGSVSKALGLHSNDDAGDILTGINKRVTFGGVTGVYGGNDRPPFSHFRSDYNSRGRGVRRGGVFNRLSL